MPALCSRRTFVGLFFLCFLAVVTHLSLGGTTAEYPEMKCVTAVAGFSTSMTASAEYFENLYFTNGTFIILTNDSLHMLLQGASYILSTLADSDDRYRKHDTVQEDRFMVATPHEAIEKGLVRPAAV
nr:hypothetical protein L203_02023 [Cryptococcus depauperatus CBS 7841]